MTSDLEQIAEEMERQASDRYNEGKYEAAASTNDLQAWSEGIRAWIAANKESPQRKAFVAQAELLGEFIDANKLERTYNFFAIGISDKYYDDFRLAYRAMIEAEKVEAERGEGA